MSSGFRGTVAEYQALYIEKNAHLEQFLEQVEPFDFYREIFPEGSFERKGHYEDSRPNGIAVSLPGKGGSVNGIALEIEGDGKAKRYIITDDLKKLDELDRHGFYHYGADFVLWEKEVGEVCPVPLCPGLSTLMGWECPSSGMCCIR